MHLATKLASAVLATVLATAPVYAIAADPTGTWQTTTGESRYKVSYCGKGGQLCAKLVWLRDDAKTEENLAYLNRNVVNGAQPASDNQWKGKVSYAGDTFSGTLTMTDSNSLKLNGCQAMFCKTMNFSRI